MQNDRVKYIDSVPILTLVISVLTIALMFVNIGIIENKLIQYIIVIALYGLIFILPSLIYMKKRGSGLLKKVTFKFEKGRYLPLTLLCTLIIIFQSCIIKFGIFKMAYDFNVYSLYGSSIKISNISFLEGILLTFAIVIIPAICEEFVFRGIVLNEYYKTSTIMAIVVSALLFAFVHFSFNLFFVYFLDGIILGLLAIISKSFIYPIIAHLIYNVFVLCFEKYIWLMSSNPDSSIFFYLIMIFVYLVLLLILTFVLEKIFRRKNYEFKFIGPDTTQYIIKPSPYGNIFRRVFLAIPMIGQIALFIVVGVLVIIF